MISGERALEIHVIDYHLSCPKCWCYFIEIVLFPWVIIIFYHHFVSHVDHFADQHSCFSPYCCHVWTRCLKLGFKKLNKNNIVNKPKHHRDDILKGGLWIGCNHWCGYCPKQQMEWSEAIFKGRNTFFLKITQEQIKGKKIAKNIQRKKYNFRKYRWSTKKKNVNFQKRTCNFVSLMIPSIFNPSLEMNWVTFRPKKMHRKKEFGTCITNGLTDILTQVRR